LGLEKEIEDAVKAIDFVGLKAHVTQQQKQKYTCILSTKDYVEALEDGDCMSCLTLSGQN